jgi:hypothetical protein
MSNQMNINLDTQVSLREASDLIVSVGASNTFHLVGEPGVGKTAMHQSIADRLGMRAIYIDVPNTELGDLGIPMPDKETGTTKLYPNEHWGFHLDEPLCIILDEITKGSPAVKNMLHPLLTLPRRIGGITLHKDSVVMTAGNLTTDAVGDVMASHTRNRLSVLNVRKPTSEEWLSWGMDKIAPVVLAWVREFPQVLGSYRDPSQSDNQYIYNPKFSQRSFVSPRSLELASNIIKQKDQFNTQTLLCALEGTIGASGARDLYAFIDIADSLPTWDSIVDKPNEAIVPNNPAALCILAFGAVQRVQRDTIGKWFDYMKRTPKELQSVFCLTASKNEEKKRILFSSQSFVDWARANQYLF